METLNWGNKKKRGKNYVKQCPWDMVDVYYTHPFWPGGPVEYFSKVISENQSKFVLIHIAESPDYIDFQWSVSICGQ